MFCQEAAVAFTRRCVPFTDVCLRGFCWFCIDFVYALLASRYIIRFSPSLCSLYLEEMLCLLCSGCEIFLILLKTLNCLTTLIKGRMQSKIVALKPFTVRTC
jgi:hypothetical protein